MATPLVFPISCGREGGSGLVSLAGLIHTPSCWEKQNFPCPDGEAEASRTPTPPSPSESGVSPSDLEAEAEGGWLDPKAACPHLK